MGTFTVIGFDANTAESVHVLLNNTDAKSAKELLNAVDTIYLMAICQGKVVLADGGEPHDFLPHAMRWLEHFQNLILKLPKNSKSHKTYEERIEKLRIYIKANEPGT